MSKLKEPSFDRDGYPTDETLQTIRDWPYTDLQGLIAFVGQAWRYPEYWIVKRKTVKASTGGWSGNEDLIRALVENHMFWALCWKSSRRGGHYVFELPVIKAEPTGKGKS